VREGFRYNVNCKSNSDVYYKCENGKALQCKGIWKIKEKGDDSYGSIYRPHNEPLEVHSYY
jgi:hypothetical protein